MYQGHTLPEVLQEIRDQKTEKRDYIVPGAKLSMEDDGKTVSFRMKNGRHEMIQSYDATDWFGHQMALSLGIPYKYYQLMQQAKPELLAQNVNAWLSDKTDTNYLFRSFEREDGNVARALLSERYHCIDNIAVASFILPELEKVPGLEIASCDLTEDHLYIKAINTHVEHEIAVGDAFQSGIIISNSEVGRGAVTIKPLLYRLVCTNGMIVNALAKRKYHVGRRLTDEMGVDLGLYSQDTLVADDKVLFMKLRDVANHALSEAGLLESLNVLKLSMDAPITGKTKNVVEVCAKEFGLSEDEQDLVLENLIKDSANHTLYGLSNAITKTSQLIGTGKYERATELESIGWDVATMGPGLWRHMNITDPKNLRKRNNETNAA